MSLRPTALAVDRQSQTGMYVVIDDPDTDVPLLIPASFDHRRIDVTREELYGGRFEVHRARVVGVEASEGDAPGKYAATAYIAVVTASYAALAVGSWRLLRFSRRLVSRA